MNHVSDEDFRNSVECREGRENNKYTWDDLCFVRNCTHDSQECGAWEDLQNIERRQMQDRDINCEFVAWASREEVAERFSKFEF